MRFTACHFLENLPSPIFFRHVAFIIDGSTSIAKRDFDICEYFGADFLSHSQSYWEIYNGLWDTENILRIYQLYPLQIDWWQRRAVQHSTSDIDQH